MVNKPLLTSGAKKKSALQHINNNKSFAAIHPADRRTEPLYLLPTWLIATALHTIR